MARAVVKRVRRTRQFCVSVNGKPVHCGYDRSLLRAVAKRLNAALRRRR